MLSIYKLELTIWLMAQIPWSRQVRKIAKTIQEMEVSDKMGIGFSGIISRVDKNFKDQIKEINDKLKRYCEVMASFMWIMIISMRKVWKRACYI